MCLSKPNIPTPVEPQAVKQPEMAAVSRSSQRNRSGMAGGTLLTSPSGVATAAPTGKATLLGQ